jgi:protein tyrosine phosphatase
MHIIFLDFGVPEDSTSFTAFVEAVRNLDDTFEVHTPIVCHCSAGIGRTGTFTVVDILLTALRNGNTDDLPMIDDLVLKMRTSRMYLVQVKFLLEMIFN